MHRAATMARRVLNVAEKPMLAKEISNILAASNGGVTSVRARLAPSEVCFVFPTDDEQLLPYHDCLAAQRAGRSKYNRNFDFTYPFNNQMCQMTMTSVSGHLTDVDFPRQYNSWTACDPIDLFEAPVIKAVKAVRRPAAELAQAQRPPPPTTACFVGFACGVRRPGQCGHQEQPADRGPALLGPDHLDGLRP